MQSVQSESMENLDDPDDHWDHESIAAMLTMYLENVDKFRNPKIRKKNVWVEISNSVGKSPDSCDKKFRNLKQTYIRLLKKKNKTGVPPSKWRYFNIFEEIYNCDGQYQPEIQQKLRDGSSVRLAKALLDFSNTSTLEDTTENGERSQASNDEVKKRLLRKRNADFQKVAVEMRDRQKLVEEKLDRLINIVEESNSIQRERNTLFEEFLKNLRHTNHEEH